MTNKWKIAFLLTFGVLILTILASGYLLLSNTLTSTHTSDVLLDLENEIEITSKLLEAGVYDLEGADEKLSEMKIGYSISSDKSNISFSKLKLLYNKEGKLVGMTTGSVRE